MSNMPLPRIPWLTLACFALILSMAALLAWSPAQSQTWSRDWHAVIPLLCAGAAWLGGVSADPDSAPDRRMQVTSALLLLMVLWLAPHLAERLLQPPVPAQELRWWLQRLAASLEPAEVALPASVISAFSLLSLGSHPVMPRILSWLAWLAGAAWALGLLHQVGALIVAHSLDAPVWVFVIGFLVLPFQMRGASIYAALPLWLLCASALTHLGLNSVAPGHAPLGAWLLGSLMLSLPVWAIWLIRLDAIGRFDRLQEAARELKAHEDQVAQEQASRAPHTDTANDEDEAMASAQETRLARKRRLRREARAQQQALEDQLDSPQAQEGADKYTRE